MYKSIFIRCLKPQRFLKPLRFYTYILLFPYLTLAQLQRVEPPHWYANMQNPSLQLMFYGKNISQYTPTVDPIVPITNITKTNNPNYLFVTLDTKNIPPGKLTFTLTNGKKVIKHLYNLNKRRDKAHLKPGFDASDVMYLIVPDRFSNGNPNNDNHPLLTEKVNRNDHSGRHGGDLQGIINQLDYIQNLGVSTIWCTPLCQDNDPVGSYHGYGQSDVYQIDARFGTNQDYLKLAEELHQRNMKLVMDYVTNHWGKHWTFDDLPTYDWIHQFPGYAQTNYRMTTQVDPHAATSDATLCANGWFVKAMPDLNQSNPLMLTYLTQNAIWWIEYANLDGLRVDTYPYNDKTAIARWTQAIMDEYPNFNIVGEVWMYQPAQIAYWQKNSAIGAIQSYNSHLPSVMDFTLQTALTQSLSEDTPSWDKGLIKIYNSFANDFLYPNVNNLLIFAENHDTPRFNQLYPNLQDYKLAMSLLATARGIPQLYYGSEIGMKGEKNTSDGDIRRDFPGGWQQDNRNAFTKEGRTEIENAYHDFTAKLFTWRKNKKVIHSGKTTHYIPEKNTYVFFRHNQTEAIMIILNNNSESTTLDTNRFKENLKDVTSGIEVLSNQIVNLQNSITVPAKTSMIIELKMQP